jgi:hypothetical protein
LKVKDKISIWQRVSPIDDDKHVYRNNETSEYVAFESGHILPRTTASREITTRVLETFNATMSHLDLFDHMREALEELQVIENFIPE